jgi:hypothetical protein
VWRGAWLIFKLMPLPSPAHGPGRPKCMPSASPTPPDVLLGGFSGFNIGEIEPFLAKLAEFPRNG